VPGDADIESARQRGGWRRLQLDEAESRALQPGGVALDFSGIAKGFAVDKVSDYLMASGFPNHLVEIGGELKGRGLRPDGHPWWVQLEPPLQGAAGTRETIIALHELAVASSGDYRKFFRQGGRRHAHTLDPRSGRSVDNGLAAVSVLHEQCMLADAQATVLMVLGLEAGMVWAVEQGVAALFVMREGDGFSEHLSPALGDLLE
jgi:thiamine biosynthesis lipoprotein